MVPPGSSSFLRVSRAQALTAFVLESLIQGICRKQLRKREAVSPSGAQRRFVLLCNRKTLSLFRVKVAQVCSQPITKNWVS